VVIVGSSSDLTSLYSSRVFVHKVFASTILQQVFIVEFIVGNQQCEDCVRVAAKNTWRAVVQVRQKVNHKRTFLFLEQLILKHNAHRDTLNIKETKDGLDFFYGQRTHAIRMTDFLQTVAPLKIKTSEKILSSDMHSATAVFKYTYSVEIIPVCKDDLLCLPPKLVRSLGMIGPLVLCTRVSNVIHLIDPATCKTAEMRPPQFWENPMSALSGSTDLTEYYVIDVQEESRQAGSNNKYAPCTLELAKASDFSTTYIARSHLGNLVHPGDHVMGYDLGTANLNDDTLAALLDGKSGGKHGFVMPDVVVVKKVYPQQRKANGKKARAWKLKTLNVDQGDLVEKDKDAEKRDKEFEAFLRDLEEDKDLRGMINLYKSGNGAAPTKAVDEGDMDTGSEGDEDDADFPGISLEELLDDLNLEENVDGEEGVEGAQMAE
jgi:nonsense-mediated mRNA decay protein 3